MGTALFKYNHRQENGGLRAPRVCLESAKKEDKRIEEIRRTRRQNEQEVLGVELAAGTVRAQSVDDRIKSLEQELLQLKEQQIELKKEATTAAQAMPAFSYRPGNGLNIEAADKSWGVRFTVETHFRYNFESGRLHQ